MEEIIEHEETGLLFKPGDVTDLCNAIVRLREQKQLQSEMREAARKDFTLHYTGPTNYELLMAIYRRALDRAA